MILHFLNFNILEHFLLVVSTIKGFLYIDQVGTFNENVFHCEFALACMIHCFK